MNTREKQKNENFKGFNLDSSDDDEQKESEKTNLPKLKLSNQSPVKVKCEETLKIEPSLTPKKDSKLEEIKKVVEKSLFEFSDEEIEIDQKLVENNVSKQANNAISGKSKSRHSSTSSSSSSSSSNSSSSSSISSMLSKSSPSTPDSTKKSTDKMSLGVKNTLEFSLSDDENSEGDEQISVSKISLSFDTISENNEKETQSPNSDEALKVKQEQEELIIKEKILQQEMDNKINAIVDEYCARQQETLFEDVLTRVLTESNICEFIRDKLINDEINSTKSVTSNLLRSICSKAIDEERQEIKLKEKQIKREIKEKIEGELVEVLVNEITGNLMRECCERVIWELKNERVTSIYEDVLDEVVRKMIDRSFLDFIFDEMIVRDKPFIKKAEPIKLIEKQPAASKRRLLSSPITNQSLDDHNLDSIQTPAKKICTQPNLETHKPIDFHPKKAEEFAKNGKNVNESTSNLTEIVKDYLADYFRKYNFKTGFSFDELDKIISNLAQIINKKTEHPSPNSCSKYLAQKLILVKIIFVYNFFRI